MSVKPDPQVTYLEPTLLVFCRGCVPLVEAWPRFDLWRALGVASPWESRPFVPCEDCGVCARWLVAVPVYVLGGQGGAEFVRVKGERCEGPVSFRVTRAAVRLANERRLNGFLPLEADSPEHSVGRYPRQGA